MTKSELIEKVVQTHGMLNMKVSEMLVNTVFDSIEEALRSGDKVEIRGFGSFTIRERNGREARNPKSGEVVRIPVQEDPLLQDRQGTERTGQLPVRFPRAELSG